VAAFGKIPVLADAPEALLETAQALHELFLRERTLRRAKLVVGLGTEKVILKKESFPALSAKEIRQTVQFGIQKDLGLEGEEGLVVHDYLTIGKDSALEGNTEYLCFGAETQSVSEKCRVLAGEGNIPVKILPAVLSYANMLQFLPPEKANDAICFLDIGASRSALVFFLNGHVDFLREVVIGGDDFTKAITGTIFHEGRAIQFTNKEALEFKLKHGYPLGFSEGMTFRGAPLGEVGAMMRPVVERLTGEIHRSIGFYKEKTGGNPVNAVYLLGGGARLRHLSGVLSERLGIPTSPLPFPKNIKISGGAQQEQAFQGKLLEFAPALALALETDAAVNLLPESYRKVHRIRDIQRVLSLVAAAALLLLAVFTLLGRYDVSQLEKRRKSLEKRATEAESKAARFDKFSRQKTQLSDRITGLDAKISQNPELVPLLRVISNTLPGNLSLIRVWMGTEEETPKELQPASQRGRKKENPAEAKKGAPGKKEETKKSNIIIIKGDSRLTSPDIRISVAQFMLALSKSGYLYDVKLQDETALEETGDFNFTITGMVNF
jgi:type IV pilus assembly protein PilM